MSRCRRGRRRGCRRELVDLNLARADQSDLPIGEGLAIGTENHLGLDRFGGRLLLDRFGDLGRTVGCRSRVGAGEGTRSLATFVARPLVAAAGGATDWLEPVVSRILSINVAFAARDVVLMPSAWAIASSCSLSLDSSIDCSRASAATGHLLSEERQWARRVEMHTTGGHTTEMIRPVRTPARSFRPEQLQRHVREPERREL